MWHKVMADIIWDWIPPPLFSYASDSRWSVCLSLWFLVLFAEFLSLSQNLWRPTIKTTAWLSKHRALPGIPAWYSEHSTFSIEVGVITTICADITPAIWMYNRQCRKELHAQFSIQRLHNLLFFVWASQLPWTVTTAMQESKSNNRICTGTYARPGGKFWVALPLTPCASVIVVCWLGDNEGGSRFVRTRSIQTWEFIWIGFKTTSPSLLC